jgi:hypothetical protein
MKIKPKNGRQNKHFVHSAKAQSGQFSAPAMAAKQQRGAHL